MLFNKRVDNPIGVDISDMSVKLVQLGQKGANLEMAAYSDVSLPTGLISHDVIQDKPGLISFLKNIFADKRHHRGTLRERAIVASVPESKAFVRVVDFPMLEAKELSSAVPLQAEQYIPLPVDQMQIDWQVVGQAQNGLKVLITATPKTFVLDLVEVLRGAGLVPQALEVESAAIARCLLPQKSQTPPTLIVDMDAYRTSLIVHADNSIQFTSSVPIGGDVINDAISQRLSVSRQEAENLKRMHGVPLRGRDEKKVAPDVAKLLSEISAGIEPVLTNLYDDMLNTIRFQEEHAESAANNAINQVVLCGGTAKLLNASDYFAGKFAADPYFSGRQVKIALGNAWVNFKGLNPPPFSQREALSYTTAIGLALRNYI